MVVNLCLPQFYTTAHCNKLCADGYDVTNLVSADPALRRRGFKLEYFLRPPVQVTLKFGFQVELCRVDVELWPWGMDQGQACKRLEISTSSDSLPSQGSSRGHKPVEQKGQMQGRDQNELNKNNKVGSKSRQSNGHQWSLQAQHWDTETVDGRQHTGHAFKNQAQTKIPTSQPESEFRLVGRCELREETKVCFSRTNYRARPPFLSPPPPQSVNCRQEELWSRGLLSLGAVTQLRVTVPFGGAASAMGLKALSVWGQPACCCPKEEVERIKRVHEASERRPTQPVFFAAPVRQTIQPQPTATPSSNLSIPEEFLDPITQEVMTLPMLLPSGVSVDSTTLEEYQKREATWGRTPNDPFTGVPFTSNSQPLPNPQLKTRIDHFLLRRGEVRRDGTLGRRGEGENPQASRLLASKFDRRPQNSSSLCLGKGSENNTSIQYNIAAGSSNQSTHLENTGLGQWLDNGNHTSNYQALPGDSKSELDRRKKRDLSGISTKELTAEKQLLPEIKRPRNDSLSVPSCSSHEQRLSASLDEALFSALQGRPSFTSNLSQQKWETPDTELLKTTQPIQSSGTPSVCKGEQTCSACSRSVSVYSTSVSSIYRLTCSHLLCHACLRRQSPRLDPATALAPSHVLCPTCRSSTARSDIIRVHH